MTSSSPQLRLPDSSSDEELLAALWRHESPHFEAAWRRFSETILPNLLRMLRARFPKDLPAHDDWVGDVVAKLMKTPRRAIEGGWNGLQAYAVRAVVNRAISDKRAEKALRPEHEKFSLAHADAQSPAADEDVPDSARSDSTERRRFHLETVLIPRLNANQRIVLLAVLAGDANSSVCAKLGVTPRELSKHRENAMKRLATLMRKFPLSN